jgi:hypothetical protein
LLRYLGAGGVGIAGSVASADAPRISTADYKSPPLNTTCPHKPLRPSPFLPTIMSEAKIAELEKKIEALTKHVTRLDDVQEIRKVQHKYGYYIDKCLFLPPV